MGKKTKVKTLSKKREKKHYKKNINNKILVYEYEITWAPIPDKSYEKLPQKIKDTIQQIHFDALAKPEKAIPELFELIEKYPDLTMLYNYLTHAYYATGQDDKADAVILETYIRHPDYLFARMEYAKLCLIKGDYDKIAEIFENKFDLKLLYPHRIKFHISEVANFMGLMSAYFFGIEDRETSEKYYKILAQLAPKHPIATLMRKRLFPGLLRRIWYRLTGQ